MATSLTAHAARYCAIFLISKRTTPWLIASASRSRFARVSSSAYELRIRIILSAHETGAWAIMVFA